MNGRQAAPLRVLHVIPTLTGGGAENFVCALLRSFDPKVVEAAVMSVYPSEDPFAQGGPRIPVFQVGRSGRYDPGFFFRMVRSMRAFAPDVVHAHLHNGKYWGRLAALAARVPVVLFTQHNPCGEPRMLPEAVVDMAVNRLTQGIATFTDPQRAAIARAERLPPEKVAAIPNGIALPAVPTPQRRARARELLGLADGAFAVFVVGRLIAQKNQQLAVRAMRALDGTAYAHLRLVVVGAGEESARMRELAAAGTGDARITFMGARTDAVELLYGADAFYMPSLAEGMPLAMLEAMSIGVPVISTPWTGVAELLHGGDFGWILADWDPATSARAFAAATGARADLSRRAALAQAFVRERHDIARIARRHEVWYREAALRAGLGHGPCAHGDPVTE